MAAMADAFRLAASQGKHKRFDPSSLPSAGVSSQYGEPHNYPYGRNDQEQYMRGSQQQTKGRPVVGSAGGRSLHSSDVMRSVLTGTQVEMGFQQMGHQRKAVKPAYEQVTDAESYARLAQSRNRATYDAASFCTEGKRRRLKRGPGWEGPAEYRSDGGANAHPSLYSTHRFHLKSHHKPAVRAGTDGMLRTLGYHNVADTKPAGTPSALANKWVDDSGEVPRGVAMTENSHNLKGHRNPITGYNMGPEYKYLPGERHFANKRLGHDPVDEFHARRGEEVATTHTRVFGQTYQEAAVPQGVRTQFDAEDGLRRHDMQSEAGNALFPRTSDPIDGDRRAAEEQYQQQLWRMHDQLPTYNEAQMIRAKYGY